MKGLDALAKVCEPEPAAEEVKTAIATLTDDQCDAIARRVISLLQSGIDTKEQKDEKPAEDQKPAEAPAEPEPGEGEVDE